MVWQALFGTTARSVITGALGGSLLGIDVPFLGDGGSDDSGGVGLGLIQLSVFGLIIAGGAAVLAWVANEVMT